MAPDSCVETLEECKAVIELVEKDKLDDAIKRLQRVAKTHRERLGEEFVHRTVNLRRRLTALERSYLTRTWQQTQAERGVIGGAVCQCVRELEQDLRDKKQDLRDKPIVDLDISYSKSPAPETGNIELLLKQFLAEMPQLGFSAHKIVAWSQGRSQYIPLAAFDPLDLKKLLSAMVERGEIDRDLRVPNPPTYMSRRG